MENEKTIDALNELVEVNNDRIEGYEKASENTEEGGLKGLFSTFEQTSNKCLQELNTEINNLGGNATEGTTASGKFFRTWMLNPHYQERTGKQFSTPANMVRRMPWKCIKMY